MEEAREKAFGARHRQSPPANGLRVFQPVDDDEGPQGSGVNAPMLTREQVHTLSALANGVIPPDDADGGAASVDAGLRLAMKIEQGANAGVYTTGLERATLLSHARFGGTVDTLS